jgi:hypothetical protein
MINRENTEWISTREAALVSDYTQEYVRKLANDKKIVSRKRFTRLEIDKASLLGYKERQGHEIDAGGET